MRGTDRKAVNPDSRPTQQLLVSLSKIIWDVGVAVIDYAVRGRMDVRRIFVRHAGHLKDIFLLQRVDRALPGKQ